MRREGRRQLHTQGGTRRHLWQPHRSLDLSRKNLEAGVLLAHNAQRRDRTGQKIQSLLGACQDLSSPICAVDVSHKPLDFSTMGARHIGTPTHWNGPMQIYHCGRGLFYQMGRGRTLSNNHRIEGMQLHLVFYNMQVRDPEVPRV